MAQDEWTSSSDEIPEFFGDDVLVFVFDNTSQEVKYICVGRFERDEGWVVTGADKVTVTHWMPLPPHPTDGK
jgi:hypothetical protein